MEQLFVADLPRPMTIVAGPNGLKRVRFGELPGHDTPGPLVTRAARQLREYFAGVRTAFDLPLDPEGTPYQRRVWSALSDIPYGSTVSYMDIAKTIQSVPRAVGGANGRNPIAVIVPCHRVIAADGSIGGYTPDLSLKRMLLDLERAQQAFPPVASPR